MKVMIIEQHRALAYIPTTSILSPNKPPNLGCVLCPRLLEFQQPTGDVELEV